MKKCNKCQKLKNTSDFYKHPANKDRLFHICKDCLKSYVKNYKKSDKYKKYSKEYKNTEKYKEYYRKYRKTEKVKQKYREYEKSPEHRKRRRVYENDKNSNDIQYRLAKLLRTRLRLAIKGNFRGGSAVKNLGCSISELKTYIENKFQPGMAWNNHGEWHIDHIKPLASFDLTKQNEILIAIHYSNLQPLWAEDNLKKGSL